MMMSEIKRKIENCFDQSSENYESNAYIQKSVCKELIKFYVDSKSFDFIKPIRGLDLGSGTGLLSSQFQEIEEFDKLHLVDISKKMIDLAKKKMTNNYVSFEINDFDHYKNFEKFNLIFSNMALHWSSEFEKLFSNLLDKISSDCVLLFSLPNSSSFKSLEKIRLKNLINKLPSEKNILKLINKKKFFYKHKEIILKKKYDKPISFFYDLRKVGANAGLDTKNKRDLFSLRNNNSKILIDYNISFFFVRKF
ncbi:MAG: hypothetical protein CMM95_00980 [Rickettsiales bacterium]|nr:hypothetical protein [Rickettsiales bacterium]